jgi:hypothetical protein
MSHYELRTQLNLTVLGDRQQNRFITQNWKLSFEPKSSLWVCPNVGHEREAFGLVTGEIPYPHRIEIYRDKSVKIAQAEYRRDIVSLPFVPLPPGMQSLPLQRVSQWLRDLYQTPKTENDLIHQALQARQWANYRGVSWEECPDRLLVAALALYAGISKTIWVVNGPLRMDGGLNDAANVLRHAESLANELGKTLVLVSTYSPRGLHWKKWQVPSLVARAFDEAVA